MKEKKKKSSTQPIPKPVANLQQIPKPEANHRLRMFQYPSAVLSGTQGALVQIWNVKADTRPSEEEFYENDYRGGTRPEGPCCLETLYVQILVPIVASAIVIPMALLISAAAFFLGAVVDALIKLKDCMFQKQPVNDEPLLAPSA